jgi:hypothetical protein
VPLDRHGSGRFPSGPRGADPPALPSALCLGPGPSAKPSSRRASSLAGSRESPSVSRVERPSRMPAATAGSSRKRRRSTAHDTLSGRRSTGSSTRTSKATSVRTRSASSRPRDRSARWHGPRWKSSSTAEGSSTDLRASGALRARASTSWRSVARRATSVRAARRRGPRFSPRGSASGSCSRCATDTGSSVSLRQGCVAPDLLGGRPIARAGEVGGDVPRVSDDSAIPRRLRVLRADPDHAAVVEVVTHRRQGGCADGTAATATVAASIVAR